MNRDKVLELAREAELVRQLALEVPFVVDRLERFAALIEREVRGGMSRDNVFELMLAAGCSKYCDPKHPELEGFIVNDSVLDRIVALIEREVRGDATPVGYTNEGYKGMQYANAEAYKEIHPDFIQRNKLTAPLFAHPTPAASAESVASVHIKDGCLIGSQRKSGVDIPDGQYGLYPIGTYPAPAVMRQLVEALQDILVAYRDLIGLIDPNHDSALTVKAHNALAAAKDAGL